MRDRHPQDAPARLDRTPALRFHVASAAAYWELYHELSASLFDYYKARARLRNGLPAVFPEGCFPSPMQFVPP